MQVENVASPTEWFVKSCKLRMMDNLQEWSGKCGATGWGGWGGVSSVFITMQGRVSEVHARGWYCRSCKLMAG